MKTAARNVSTLILILMGGSAFAQSAPGGATASVATAPVLPATIQQASAPSQAAPAPSESEAKTSEVSSSETASSSSLTTPSKIPDSVKNAIKRLNNTGDNMTLEDINAAREAIARLDVMIDIEKRLSDLSALRKDRDEAGLAAAIPASALGRGAPAVQQMPSLPTMPTLSPPAMSPTTPSFSDISVDRVQGSVGKYQAMVRVGDAKPVLVREGDKLSDGSLVKVISNQNIVVVRDKKERLVAVKNVNTVSGIVR